MKAVRPRSWAFAFFGASLCALTVAAEANPARLDGSRLTRLELANGGIVVGRVIEVLPDALHVVGPDLNRKIVLSDLTPGTLAQLGLKTGRASGEASAPQGLELTRARLREGETALRDNASLWLIPMQTQEVYFGGSYLLEPVVFGPGYGWPCWTGSGFGGYSGSCGSSLEVNIKF